MSRKLAFVSIILLALAGAAVAQTSAPAKASSSLWSVIYSGLEWPAYLILAGSLAAIALIVEHFITVRAITIAPSDQVKKAREFIERRAFRECLDGVRKSSTFFARVMSASLQHARHGFDAMHEAALEKSGEISGQMFRKIEYLNLLGNLGPLMGLLGTVLGMILAFSGLAQGGGEAGADAGNLARGISLALVNTLLGLGLAILGLGFFGICRNRIESLTVQATVQTLDLLEYFRPSALSAGGGEARRTAPPAPARAGATEE